ncbi:MAG: hypothetical protein KBG30_07540 [Bacteroidales bacterium]|jgi:thiol-disulfide isomerase/thioredoxin|nr:hypothetical protein [Bacteroidales bacterium]
MRNLCIIVIVVGFFILGCNKDISDIPIKSIEVSDGTSISVDSFLNNGVALIFSYECGYCMRDISLYNEMNQKLKQHKPDIITIAFSDTYRKESAIKYPDMANYYEKHNLKWDIAENSDSIYSKIWKKEVFPQFHYIKSGKILKSIVAPYPNEIDDFVNYIISDY